MNNDKEFYDIPGYQGFYQISRDGQVKSMPRIIISEYKLVEYQGTIMHPHRQIMSEKIVLRRDGKRKCFTIKKLLERTFNDR